jgi:hypothetical protein
MRKEPSRPAKKPKASHVPPIQLPPTGPVPETHARLVDYLHLSLKGGRK